MKSHIELAYGKEGLRELYKDIPGEIEAELEQFNKYVRLYNLLEDGSEEKKLVFEYLTIIFTQSIAQNISLDLGVPLKNEITEKDIARGKKLQPLINGVLDKFNDVIERT